MTSENSDVPTPWARGGPHGYGDPNDMRLRKVEKEVLIKNKVREASKEKCKDLVLGFRKCAAEHGLGVAFVCRNENNMMIDCLGKWYKDPELNEQMKNEYLKERSEFRRTGIKKKLVFHKVK